MKQILMNTLFLGPIVLILTSSFCYGEETEDDYPDDEYSMMMIQESPRKFSSRSLFAGIAFSDNGRSSVVDCDVTSISDGDRESIVNLHNSLRRKVAKGYEPIGYRGGQPMAANMTRMGYDIDLEDLAAKFVETCSPHFKANDSIEGFHNVWHSVYHQSSDTKLAPYNLSNVILSYYRRFRKRFLGTDALQPFYGKNSVTRQDVRPYAIIVNSNTRSIGCAQATYYDKKTHKYNRLASCYYGDGILYGNPLYQYGPTCSGVHKRDCDNGLVIKESGLEGKRTNLPEDYYPDVSL